MTQIAQVQGHTDSTVPQDAAGQCHVCGAEVVVKSPGAVLIKNAILLSASHSGGTHDGTDHNGRPPETPVALIRWGTTEAQEVRVGTLGDIVERARGREPPSSR